MAERTTPSVETIASSTRCRSALVRATTRQSMSPGPVMVCDLEHFGDRGEPFGYRIVAAGLADLEGDEGSHLVAERGRVHLGSVSGDQAALGHPLQACLHGAAGDPQPPGGLEYAHPGLGGQQFDQRGVKPVDQPMVTGGHAVHEIPALVRNK